MYLIDDNKHGQMLLNYKIDFSKAPFKDYIEIKWLQDLSPTNFELIKKDATCILIHDSLDEKEKKEYLIAMAKDRKIPYCTFSNGFTATEFNGESISEIKKDRFYLNFEAFLKHFKLEKKIEFKLLSYGENYEIEKAFIIQDRLINGTLFNYRNNFDYSTAFPINSPDYKDLKELVHLSMPNIDFFIHEDEYLIENFTAQLMRQEIIKMVKIVKQNYE